MSFIDYLNQFKNIQLPNFPDDNIHDPPMTEPSNPGFTNGGSEYSGYIPDTSLPNYNEMKKKWATDNPDKIVDFDNRQVDPVTGNTIISPSALTSNLMPFLIISSVLLLVIIAKK